MRPTAKQWRYNAAKCHYALKGVYVTDRELAKEIGCTPTTISIWKRDDRFLAWDAATTAKHRPAKREEALLAIYQRAINGQSKYGDMVIRLEEIRHDSMAESRDGVQPGAPTVQVGVAFYGLPQPPTPAQAEAMRPPPGSAMVLTAAGVLEDRGRK